MATYLSAVGNRPVTAAEETMVFMTTSEVEVMLKKERRNLNIFDFSRSEPPHAAKVAVKPYPVAYALHSKFDGRRGNTREHVVRFQ